MGGREVGGMTNLLPGYRSVTSVEDRKAVESYWRLPPSSILGKPGLAALEQLEALAQEK